MFKDKSAEIFSSRDAIRSQLIEYAQNYLDIQGVDFAKTSYLSYLINVLSVLTSNLIYYNTATYREFFLTRAQQKESVLNLAAMLGYIPSKAVPATAELLITFPIRFPSTSQVVLHGRHDPENSPYMFYAGTVPFANENEIRIDVIISKGRLLSCKVIEINKQTGGVRNLKWRFTTDKNSINFVIQVTQVKEVKEEFYFPKLKPYEFYDKFISLENEFSDISLASTIENEDRVFWEDKTSLFMMTPGDSAYSYRINDKGVTIYFGNGVVGTQPPEGAKCEITISTTHGYKGNVIAGSIVSSEPLYVDVASERGTIKKLVKISCINTTPALGGRDYPSIDEIRNNAITQVSTNKRLVSEHDFNSTSNIVEDLPIQNAIPILKRSDLKRNEVVLYTDLIFQDSYVPTRNSTITLYSDDIIQATDYYNLPEYILIRSGDSVTISPNRYENEEDIDDIEYVSIFDVLIDTANSTSKYFYMSESVEKSLVLKEYFLENQNRTIAIPVRVEFDVQKYDPYTDSTSVMEDMLTIKFVYEKIIDSSLLYSSLSCDVEVAESVTFPMTAHDTTTESWFEVDIEVDSIPEGDLYFDFQLKGTRVSDGVVENIFNCQTNTVVKNDLSDKMYSLVRKLDNSRNGVIRHVPMEKEARKEYLQSLIDEIDEYIPEETVDSTSGIWGLMYDVPLVRKDYLEYLEEQNLKDTFIDTVIHRVAVFDVRPYRMLTDNVNIKFSNTSGTLTNMNFNKVTGGYIDVIDPDTIPQGKDPGYTACVTNTRNPWSEAPYNQKQAGFLARRIGVDDWAFIRMIPNDIYWLDLVNGPTKRNSKDNYKVIYNGENLYTLNKDIPLRIELNVWYDSSVNISEQGLVNNIKEAIIENFLPKLGYDKNIFVSEIINVVHGVYGVTSCKVIKPEHDIFFNYELDQLNHEDLLRYSPQLVYITYSNINVHVRKSSII